MVAPAAYQKGLKRRGCRQGGQSMLLPRSGCLTKHLLFRLASTVTTATHPLTPYCQATFELHVTRAGANSVSGDCHKGGVHIRTHGDAISARNGLSPCT